MFVYHSLFFSFSSFFLYNLTIFLSCVLVSWVVSNILFLFSFVSRIYALIWVSFSLHSVKSVIFTVYFSCIFVSFALLASLHFNIIERSHRNIPHTQSFFIYFAEVFSCSCFLNASHRLNRVKISRHLNVLNKNVQITSRNNDFSMIFRQHYFLVCFSKCFPKENINNEMATRNYYFHVTF